MILILCGMAVSSIITVAVFLILRKCCSKRKRVEHGNMNKSTEQTLQNEYTPGDNLDEEIRLNSSQ